MQKYPVGRELTNVIAILLGMIFNLYNVSEYDQKILRLHTNIGRDLDTV